MGGSHSDSIKIATVNYSGITDSPFEFESGDAPEIKKLNLIFQCLFHQLKAALERHQAIFKPQENEKMEHINAKSKDTTSLQSKTKSSKKDAAENPIWRLFDRFGRGTNKQVTQFMMKLKNQEYSIEVQRARTQQQQQKLKQQRELKKFDWGISHLDKNMHKGRYCPQYRQNVGIQTGRFNSMLAFFSRWKFQFEKNKAYSKLNSQNSAKQRHVCLVYDYLIYKTIVEYCYHQYFETINWSIIPREIIQDGPRSKQSANQREEKKPQDQNQIKNQKSQRRAILLKYEQLLEKYHSMPYLKHQKKYQSLRKVIYQNDVIFLQDISDQLLNALKGEGDLTIANRLGYNDDCCIVINNSRSKFANIYDALKITDPSKRKKKPSKGINMRSETQANPEFLSIDDFNYEYDQGQQNQRKYIPAVCFIDNFLIISLRFTSKQAKCIQIFKFFTHMLKINQRYSSLIIIIGGDFNCDLTDYQQLKDLASDEKVRNLVSQQSLKMKFKEFNQHFYISNTGKTTKKKRTWLQSQSNKAQVTDIKQRDFLISNHPILRTRIDGKRMNQDVLLPSKQHPFDHFFILGEINKNTPKKKNSANN